LILERQKHKAPPNPWEELWLTLLFGRLDVDFHQRAAADQVAVVVDVVDAEAAGREAGLFAAMGAIPIADEVFPACARRSSMSMLPFLRNSI
jgi:hypothetical protein